MARYASTTTVSAEKSRAEIETILKRYGAQSFVSGWDAGRSVIGFEVKGRRVRFVLPMPSPEDKAIKLDKRGWVRSDAALQAAFDQEVRQRWRALALVIKAKLEAVEAGITVFEDEFLAHIVLPSGETVGQWLKPQIGIAYQEWKMPPMLPDYSDRPQ